MIFRRVRTLLGLSKSGSDRAAAPRSTLGGELSVAGIGEREWVALQRRGGRLYPDIGGQLLQTIAQTFPAQVAQATDAADRVLRHEFDVLGSGPFTPHDPARRGDGRYQKIDWRLDPLRRYRFPDGVPHKQWNFETMRSAGADIKFPWELGRCQHLVVLGQAFRLTGQERYAMEIFDELEDFGEANPTGMGVQWTCTMDVALRAANWAIALAMVRSCTAIGEDRWLQAYRQLFDHGAFIEHNLENTYEVTSNHFLSNIVGLYFVADVFAELPAGVRWRASCRSWLEQEMRTQVLDDGADYESSVPYHRLVTELFLGAARLSAARGEPLSDDFRQRLHRMCGYLATILRPDGLMPQVGDADDGRLHILSQYGRWKPQDARHLLGAAAAFFDVPAWRTLAGDDGQWEAAWWGFEPRALRGAAEIDFGPVSHFPKAGITVLRTPRVYLLITNGVVGTTGFGNHKHNDQLGLEYHLDGVPVFVDPGSYVYTSDPENRNRFRGTAWHNTLMVDDVEQNEIRPEWLFRMFEQAHPEHLLVEASEASLRYQGRHSGYRRLADPIVHTRSFTLDRTTSSLRIVDVLEGQGSHRVRWHFHCAPGTAVRPAAGGRIELAVGSVNVRLCAAPELNLRIQDAWYSPSYGVRIACHGFDLETAVEIRSAAEYVFEISPGDVRH